MRPTSLKPAARVRFTDERGSAVLEFVRRDRGKFEGAPMCRFRDANGGTVSVPDAFVARRCERVVQESRPRG